MQTLRSELASLSDTDKKDQNAIAKSKSWWNTLNPWGTAAPNDQQKQTMEQERLQRTAATRIKEIEFLTLSVRLDVLQKEKDKKMKAENERQERIRTENLRREEDRRNKEHQEWLKRRREEERIARELSETLRQERERQEKAAMEARQKEEQERREKEAKRRQQEEERRKKLWEKLRKQEEDHLGYARDRHRSQRQDTEWQETERRNTDWNKSQRSANARARQDSKAYRSGSHTAFDRQKQHTASGKDRSSCRHMVFWHKIEGRRVCSHCQRLQYKFLYQCPTCGEMGCAACMREMKKGDI